MDSTPLPGGAEAGGSAAPPYLAPAALPYAPTRCTRRHSDVVTTAWRCSPCLESQRPRVPAVNFRGTDLASRVFHDTSQPWKSPSYGSAQHVPRVSRPEGFPRL